MKLEYKIDLLTSKLSYLRKDREYCQEVTKEAMTEFHAEFMRLISDLSKHQKELIYKFMNNNVAQPQNPLGRSGITKQRNTRKYKKVFKEIAKKDPP